MQVAQFLVEKGEQDCVAAAFQAAPCALPRLASAPRQPPQRARTHGHAQFGGHPGHEAAQLLGGWGQPRAYFFSASGASLRGRPARRPSAKPATPWRCQRVSQRLTALRPTAKWAANWSMVRPRWCPSTAYARRRMRGCGPWAAQASKVTRSAAVRGKGAANMLLRYHPQTIHLYF